MNSKKVKLLIIRFSSFGDILQAVSIPQYFKLHYRKQHEKKNLQAPIETHWLVRSDFASLLENQIDSSQGLDQVISFSRDESIWSLIRLGWQLAHQDYTHVYDAHNNLRSQILCLIFYVVQFLGLIRGQLKPFYFLRRSKNRLRRLLYFKWHIPVLPKPFVGTVSYLKPLSKWGIDYKVYQDEVPKYKIPDSIRQSILLKLNQNQFFENHFIALVPSAAWEMKRWPVEFWKKLVELMPWERFVVLGGPEDHFCAEIAKIRPEFVINFSGKLNLLESSAVLSAAKLVISGDTGLFHVADQLQKNAFCIMGPAGLGFPFSKNSQVLSAELSCQPCSKDGRGKCRNQVYKKCLLEIKPELVVEQIEKQYSSKELN